MTDTLMHTYSPQAVTFEKGEGILLWDENGKQYLDALSGIAVCGLGHAHPAISEAIADQAKTLIHTSNLYQIKHQQELADRLCEVSGMDKVFFSNSGAEANEAAIKLARLYGHQKNIDSPEIIVMEGSFHGRTLATLTATGNRKVQAGFEPLVQGFVRAPYNDIEAIRNIAQNSQNIVAILVEPVLGEGGIQIPDTDYLNGIREICNENDWLMMLDEIQTGMCRSGQWFAFQHNNIQPDVMTLAKALGNGVPIGACLAHGKAADVFQPGMHGSTYGGNPLVCRVAKTVIDTLDNSNAAEHAKTLGTYILNGFNTALKDVNGVNDIRGMGLLLAIELDNPCVELVSIALEKGLLINVTAERVIRLLPPLIMNEQQADQLINMVSEIVRSFLSK
ncbi:MAG: aspartate aminotransferase family protein [Gammaproteobacteria bacterium]|nr:aspartate aminotransferase family protein [Gammaproteobacteria bacterium]